MFRKICILSFCGALLLILSSCMGFKAYWNMDADLIESSYKVADNLIARITPSISFDQCILISSFVNIDNLEESSTFGRTISECITSRLAQRGYTVVEMKLRKSVFIRKKGGEFMLSRELKNISTEYNVQAVIVGTYSVAQNLVYVSSRVIKPSDNIILATYDYALPLGSNTLKMLQESSL